jgi:hypothetical protein
MERAGIQSRIRRVLASASAAALGAGLLTAAGIALAPTASAAPPQGRIIIGDSVVGMNVDAMRKRGFTVSYEVSRQFSAARSVMGSYGSRLPRNVVIHLGTNGSISLSECQALVRQATSKRTVFLVTVRVPRSWQNSNNQTLRSCDRSFPGKRVHIIDWHRLSNSKPQWFYPDGYHPRESTGAVAYANLISKTVQRLGR